MDEEYTMEEFESMWVDDAPSAQDMDDEYNIIPDSILSEGPLMDTTTIPSSSTPSTSSRKSASSASSASSRMTNLEKRRMTPEQDQTEATYVENTGCGEYQGLQFIDTAVLHSEAGPEISIEKLLEGADLAHVTVGINRYDRPHNAHKLKPHAFDEGLDNGIFANGLRPFVTDSHESPRAINAVWVCPVGRTISSIHHILKNHRDGLIASNGIIAVCIIDKEHVGKFVNFNTGSAWTTTCRPAYSKQTIPISRERTFTFKITEIPSFLKNVKVLDHIVPLKTLAEKMAVRKAYYESEHGIAMRKAYHESEHGKAMRLASHKAWRESDHGKAWRKAYQESDHGKAIIKAGCIKRRNAKSQIPRRQRVLAQVLNSIQPYQSQVLKAMLEL